MGTLLVGCATRLPPPSATWEQSLEARPRSVGVEVEAATPSEPGDLFDRGNGGAQDVLSRAFLVCRLDTTGVLEGLDARPDRFVELTLGRRHSSFHQVDAASWDFSLGLVDLEPGDAVGLQVTDDRIGTNEVILQGTERWTGGRLGWTVRNGSVRTSVRCHVPPARFVERSLRHRLRDQGSSGARGPAAILGWSDPRVHN